MKLEKTYIEERGEVEISKPQNYLTPIRGPNQMRFKVNKGKDEKKDELNK